jgi:hypothetical protein
MTIMCQADGAKAPAVNLAIARTYRVRLSAPETKCSNVFGEQTTNVLSRSGAKLTWKATLA